MSTHEERTAELEQLTVSRIDLVNAISKLTLQQAQNSSDAYHEITLLLGIIGSQRRDIGTIKEDVSALKERLVSLETKFDEHTALLTQILARLPEKP